MVTFVVRAVFDMCVRGMTRDQCRVQVQRQRILSHYTSLLLGALAFLETTDTAASFAHSVVLLHGRLREGGFRSRKLTAPCVFISSGQQAVAVL